LPSTVYLLHIMQELLFLIVLCLRDETAVVNIVDIAYNLDRTCIVNIFLYFVVVVVFNAPLLSLCQFPLLTRGCYITNECNKHSK